MKRSIGLILAIMLVMAVALMGCAPETQVETPDTPDTSEAPAPTEAAVTQEPDSDPVPAEEKTIGLIIWGTTGTAALQEIELLNKAAEVTGVKVEVLASGYNADAQLQDAENFVATGVDGILICNSSEEVVAKIADLCEENEIYFGQFHRSLSKPEIVERVYNSPYYVGASFEDEEGTAYILGKTIADMGIKNVAITTGPHGDSTAEGRYAGLKKALDEFGVNVLAEQWDVTTGEAAVTATQNFMTSFPELELVATMFSVEAIKGAYTAIENAGKDIKIAAQDTTGDTEFDVGALSSGKAIMAGGHLVNPLFSYMLLANAIIGQPLSDKPVEAKLTQIVFTPERAEVYFSRMEQGTSLLGYTADEMKMMFRGTNPDVTAEDIVNMAAAWSVEDFLKRHGE